MPSPTPQLSLYERLGGVYGIAVVVDDLIDRVMADARLNANPAVNEAHHKVAPAGFKYLVTEMMGMATGVRRNTRDARCATHMNSSTLRRKNGTLSWTTSNRHSTSSRFRPSS